MFGQIRLAAGGGHSWKRTMGFELFSTKPWHLDQNKFSFAIPRGMLGREEATMLYYLTKEYYLGRGEIIDAGAFLGASAYCLAKGLSENNHIRQKTERIHSYDLFQVWHEPGSSDQEMAESLRSQFGIEVANYESTLGIFSANLGEFARLVTVHPGDILDQNWSGRAIEILFVDICKTLPIWKHVLSTFYRSLVPRISVVVHQDWHHPSLPYIHIGQEALAEYFEIVEPKASDSAAFLLKERIPERILRKVSDFEFSDSEKLFLIDRAIDRFTGKARFLKLSKAVLLLEMGRRAEASEIIHRNVFAHGEEINSDEQTYFEIWASHVADRIERAGIEAPEGYDEAAYLRANPEVEPLVLSGVFASGLHHWFRHGRWDGKSWK